MSKERTAKDTVVIFLGLALVVGIGVWSFFRSGKNTIDDTTDAPAPEESATDFRTISLQELKDIVLQKQPDENALIIDMRPTSLWADEHIIGSESLLFEDAEQSLQPTDAEKSKDWIIVAPDSSTGGRLVALLRNRGVPDEHIRVFDGTYETWKEKTGLIIRRADPTSALDATKVTLASPEEAEAKIGAGGQWFILDIRDTDAFSKGHIASATNIPFEDIEAKRSAIPSTASILVYGANDRESFSGGVLLFDLGFFNTLTLSAGFDDWKAKNLPTGK